MKLKSQVKISMLEMIKKRMSEKGWNQAALADASDVSPPTISRLLKSNYKQIGLENIFSILNALDLIETGIQQKPKSPPGWTFDEKAREMYDFLTNIVSEGNEGSRKGYSRSALCEIIIEDMKKQLIKENDLKKTDHRVR